MIILKTDLLICILGIIGIIIFIQFHDMSSPVISMDISVSKEEALSLGTSFMQELGFDLNDYESLIMFGGNNMTSFYLQNTVGMEKANELMNKEIPTWFWYIRWFKELEKEEFGIMINPSTSDIISFEHIVPETTSGSDLSEEEALIIAENFASKYNELSDYELISSNSDRKSNRTDYNFEWKKKDYAIVDASIILGVNLIGNEISGYSEYLKIPEEFERDFKNQMSHGQLVSLISAVFMLLLIIAAAVVSIRKYKSGDIKWKFGMIAAAILIVVMIASSINSIPLSMLSYPTFMEKSTFQLTLIIMTLISTIFYGAYVVFSGSGGESICREVYGEKNLVLNTEQKDFSKKFVKDSLRGYALAFMILGFFTIFYIFGRRFGVWVPADAPYSNILGTFLPFLAPLLIAILASVSEEFIFRLFSIPLCKKYLKFTVLAIIIPAFIWGCGHSSYIIFPVYTRIIEVTIIGIIFGLFFLKYGLTSVISAHYIIDSLLIGLPLLKLNNVIYLTSEILILLLPIIVTVSYATITKYKNMSIV